jgi:hypothetical protein
MAEKSFEFQVTPIQVAHLGAYVVEIDSLNQGVESLLTAHSFETVAPHPFRLFLIEQTAVAKLAAKVWQNLHSGDPVKLSADALTVGRSITGITTIIHTPGEVTRVPGHRFSSVLKALYSEPKINSPGYPHSPRAQIHNELRNGNTVILKPNKFRATS